MAANGILLKKRWRAGEVSLGLFVHCTDPAFANILSYLGFDFLIEGGVSLEEFLGGIAALGELGAVVGEP